MPLKTILVVEDNYLLALGLQDVLEAHGWQVFGPVGSVRDALSILESGLPAVAVLDVNLGTETVTPVAEYLKRQGVPFILATAYPKPEQYGGAVLAGVPNAGKPTDQKRLIAMLNQVTGC